MFWNLFIYHAKIIDNEMGYVIQYLGTIKVENTISCVSEWNFTIYRQRRI